MPNLTQKLQALLMEKRAIDIENVKEIFKAATAETEEAKEDSVLNEVFNPKVSGFKGNILETVCAHNSTYTFAQMSTIIDLCIQRPEYTLDDFRKIAEAHVANLLLIDHDRFFLLMLKLFESEVTFDVFEPFLKFMLTLNEKTEIIGNIGLLIGKLLCKAIEKNIVNQKQAARIEKILDAKSYGWYRSEWKIQINNFIEMSEDTLKMRSIINKLPPRDFEELDSVQKTVVNLLQSPSISLAMYFDYLGKANAFERLVTLNLPSKDILTIFELCKKDKFYTKDEFTRVLITYSFMDPNKQDRDVLKALLNAGAQPFCKRTLGVSLIDHFPNSPCVELLIDEVETAECKLPLARSLVEQKPAIFLPKLRHIVDPTGEELYRRLWEKVGMLSSRQSLLNEDEKQYKLSSKMTETLIAYIRTLHPDQQKLIIGLCITPGNSFSEFFKSYQVNEFKEWHRTLQQPLPSQPTLLVSETQTPTILPVFNPVPTAKSASSYISRWFSSAPKKTEERISAAAGNDNKPSNSAVVFPPHFDIENPPAYQNIFPEMPKENDAGFVSFVSNFFPSPSKKSIQNKSAASNNDYVAFDYN